MLFLISLAFNNLITFGIKKRFNTDYKTLHSLSILLNSSMISTCCYLFNNQMIQQATLNTAFQYSKGFLINDLIILPFFTSRNEYILKLIHHFISLYAINYSLYRYPLFISTLFFSEIVNYPLEFRSLSKNNIFRNTCAVVLYVLFSYTRVIKPFYLIYYDNYWNILYIQDKILFVVIYTLWIYWFCKINLLIYKKTNLNLYFQKHTKGKLFFEIF